MPSFNDYTQLRAWIMSRKLAKEIYQISDKFPVSETFVLQNQLRRSSISVPSNLAEGIGRQHRKEKIQFVYVARGSLFELETQLYLAYDLLYIDVAQLRKILVEIAECKKLINGYINYLKRIKNV